MKLVQLVDSLFPDYVSRTVKAFAGSASVLGMDAFACSHQHPVDIDVTLAEKSILTCMHEDDILILHMGSYDTDYLLDFVSPHCRKIVYYYGGLDPAELDGAPRGVLTRSRISLDQLAILAEHADLGIASTDENVKALSRAGFGRPLFKSEPVVPSLVVGSHACSRDGKGGVKVVSVGEVIPSRRHEDVLRAFKVYRDAYDPDASLAVIGRESFSDPYIHAMKAYASALSLCADEVFPDDEGADSRIIDADVLLSLSGTEDHFSGYVTAMRAGVPIIAFGSTSMSGILGDAYLGLDARDPVEVARALRGLMGNGELRTALIAKGMKRAEAFTAEAAKARISDVLQRMIGGR